jgi:hypothetical protein
MWREHLIRSKKGLNFKYVPHQPSSEPSAQSTLPSQKNSLGKHEPSAQPRWSGFSHSAASSNGCGTFASETSFLDATQTTSNIFNVMFLIYPILLEV